MYADSWSRQFKMEAFQTVHPQFHPCLPSTAALRSNLDAVFMLICSCSSFLGLCLLQTVFSGKGAGADFMYPEITGINCLQISVYCVSHVVTEGREACWARVTSFSGKRRRSLQVILTVISRGFPIFFQILII